MDYERIILEMLSRIQRLEEQVTVLSEKKNGEEEQQMTMQEIREYIITIKQKSKAAGNETVVLRSGDIHKELNLKSRLPMVCNAMRQCMQDGDVVLKTTPSGNSSTIEIQYTL